MPRQRRQKSDEVPAHLLTRHCTRPSGHLSARATRAKWIYAFVGARAISCGMSQRVISCLVAATLILGARTSLAQDTSSLHGFDFEVGHWRVHHRVKRADGWHEFDGTSVNWPLMHGYGNVEDNDFNRPTGVTHGVALRAYDAKTGLWAIWWVDSRDPHLPMDPPVKGRFDGGVGTFYSDGLINGKPTRTRYIWSRITPKSARWEQAFSTDSGKTWDTNWIMEFQRR
jgi:hypothetical protein